MIPETFCPDVSVTFTQACGKAILVATMTKHSLAQELFTCVFSLVGDVDDVTCDWYTDATGGLYINGDVAQKVDQNIKAAMLVDAANILLHGEALKLKDGGV